MKKILFVCNNMEFGGVQKSLVNLMKNICNKYEVSLLLFSDKGYYMSQIPSNVELVGTNKYLNLLGSTQEQTKKQSLNLYVLRAILVLFTRIFNNVLPHNLIFSTYRNLEGYDIAISFTQNINDKSLAVGCNEFVLKKVKSKNKFTFVHSDFSKYGGNSARSRKIYAKFDRIACVSKGCKETFVSEIPLLEPKTNIVYNCHDFDEIINQANLEPIIFDEQYFNIVSISRLSEEKGILRALSAINVIKQKGYPILWHIIGDGNQRQDIQNYIKEHNLENTVILYGSQSNPYKYLLNADLFLLPSFHEAAPLVFSEAQALKVPILSTETISAKEMIIDNNAGFVCKNDLEDIVDKLLYILSNKDELENIRNSIGNNCNNYKAINQFHKLVESCI